MPVLSRFCEHRDRSTGWHKLGIPVGRFFAVLLALGGGLVLFVRAAGAVCRIGPRHLIEAATEVVTECAPPAAGWRTGVAPWRATLRADLGAARAAASCRKGFPVSAFRDWIWLSRSCTCRGLVIYLSCTRRIPALVTPRITRQAGPLAAAVSEVPGRLKQALDQGAVSGHLIAMGSPATAPMYPRIKSRCLFDSPTLLAATSWTCPRRYVTAADSVPRGTGCYRVRTRHPSKHGSGRFRTGEPQQRLKSLSIAPGS